MDILTSISSHYLVKISYFFLFKFIFYSLGEHKIDMKICEVKSERGLIPLMPSGITRDNALKFQIFNYSAATTVGNKIK